MKTLLRALIALSIVVWLGGLLFFPIVAAVSFTHLPDTHAAGTVVGACLRILHQEGLFTGTLLVLLFVAASATGLYPRYILRVPLLMVVVMLALTAYSQFSIIPRMELYRTAAGGVIDAVPKSDPNREGFDRLHNQSTYVEEGVMIAGLVLVILLARAEGKEFRRSGRSDSARAWAEVETEA
jgi:Domain of unknown function (DUF4149)